MGDIIESINGTKLTEVEGGTWAWINLIAESAEDCRTVVVRRRISSSDLLQSMANDTSIDIADEAENNEVAQAEGDSATDAISVPSQTAADASVDNVKDTEKDEVGRSEDIGASDVSTIQSQSAASESVGIAEDTEKDSAILPHGIGASDANPSPAQSAASASIDHVEATETDEADQAEDDNWAPETTPIIPQCAASASIDNVKDTKIEEAVLDEAIGASVPTATPAQSAAGASVSAALGGGTLSVGYSQQTLDSSARASAATYKLDTSKTSATAVEDAAASTGDLSADGDTTVLGASYSMSLDADTSLALGYQSVKDGDSDAHTQFDATVSRALGGGASVFLEMRNLAGDAEQDGTAIAIGSRVSF